ncbi:MAG: M50 family metallopeptidase [Longimicrobiales bacterium]|nr:M50 family metallopeptidase [Longimicrobiales bacterium]
MTDVAHRKLRFLAGFAVYFGALWLLWDTPVVYPLKIFVVLLHEVSHAVAAVATGGSIQRIVLDPNQGGATYTLGGSAFLTLSAGYLGSLGWGALMVEASRARRIRSDLVNGAIGGLVVALTALFVRNFFGIGFGVLFGLGLVAASRKLSVAANTSLLLTLGLTSSLYAILDIKSDILDRPHLESDAHMLADLTGIPTVAWGILWIGVALGATFLLFRRAYRQA